MFSESLATSRLILRPLCADDAQAIFDGYSQDPEVTRYLSWRPHASIEDTQRFVQTCLMGEVSRTYAMVLQATDRVIGSFDIRKTGTAKLEVGYVLARAHWRQGLMTEALGEVVDWALRQTDVWRIGAVADIDNIGSMRVMAKAGLQREGILRRWLIHPNIADAPRDCVSFAKTW